MQTWIIKYRSKRGKIQYTAMLGSNPADTANIFESIVRGATVLSVSLPEPENEENTEEPVYTGGDCCENGKNRQGLSIQ